MNDMQMDQNNNKTETELLSELLTEQRLTAKRTKRTMLFTGGVFIVLLISAVLLIPRGFATLDRVNQLTESAMETSESVNLLVTENTETVTNVANGISKIDFENLNDAIKALHDTIEPFANFMRLFKR